MIYAYGDTDAIKHHAKRGAKSLNLKSYVKNIPPPKTAKYFDFLSVNVSVHLTYYLVPLFPCTFCPECCMYLNRGS